jgi:hypothetical protein
MQTTQTTRKAQTTEQVAALIALAGVTPAEATIRNEDGWTFDVRWADGEYASDTDFTRATRVLSAEDLAEAIATADRWADGDFDSAAY